MGKEILLYNYIFDETVQEIIERMDENMDEEITLRVNSGGGSVFSGWGVAAKMQEHGNVNITVDGIAASMAALWCLYAKEVTCYDISRLMLHRADAPVSNDKDQMLLDSVNKDLRSKFKMKLNADKFKEIAGMSIDEMFDSKEQVNIWLTAKQAKAIGLVNKVIKLNPTEAKAMNDFANRIAAEYKPETQKSTNMNLAELKVQHPSIFEAAANEGFKLGVIEGAKTEKERVEAILVFNDIDPKKVKEMIESGKPITMKEMSEFTLKSASAEALKTLSGQTQTPLQTTAPAGEKTEAAKKMEKMEQDLFAALKLDGKAKPNGMAYRKFESA